MRRMEWMETMRALCSRLFPEGTAFSRMKGLQQKPLFHGEGDCAPRLCPHALLSLPDGAGQRLRGNPDGGDFPFRLHP